MEAEKYCPKCFKKYAPSLEKCPDDGQHLVSLMERDLTGEVLDDKYTVLELIGRGGMGVVYKAEQHLLKRIVALKVMRREVVQDETAVKRFLYEARAIASLQSPHTVTLHDFGVSKEGLIYYTMELLKGQPLSALIEREAPLDYRRAVTFMLEACDSLQEAHEANILHRDLKPDNLFILNRWEKEHIKVLDFGIAKLIGDTSMDSVTQTGFIVGTPKYLSPEQALGIPCVPASDLYSLGVVLYEMLTGSPPFVGDTALKTMWKHLQEPAPPILIKNPNIKVPRSIDLFLRRVLQKKVHDRPQTALEFRKGLEVALDDHVASSETAALRPLGPTVEGTKVTTEIMDRRLAEPVADFAHGAATAPQQPEIATERLEPEAPGTGGEALSATTEKEQVASSLSKEPTVEPPPEEPAVGTPGKGTRALVGDIGLRLPTKILSGIAVAVALLALLIVWRPWVGGDGEGNAAPPATASGGGATADIAPVLQVTNDGGPPRTDATSAPALAGDPGGTAAAGGEAKTDSGKSEESAGEIATAMASLEEETDEAPTEVAETATEAEGETADASAAAGASEEREKRLAEEMAARKLAEEEARKIEERKAEAEAKVRRAQRKAKEEAVKIAAKKAEAENKAREMALKRAEEAAEDDDFSEFKE